MKEKKGNLLFSGFCIPVDHRLKIKESENIDEYLIFAKEVKCYGT